MKDTKIFMPAQRQRQILITKVACLWLPRMLSTSLVLLHLREVQMICFWSFITQKQIPNQFFGKSQHNRKMCVNYLKNKLMDAKIDLYQLQAHKRAIKRNLKRQRLKKWREPKRNLNNGKTGFFHFPQHSDVRLARELQDEVLEPVSYEAFVQGPADMFARNFKLLPGTRVSVVNRKGGLLFEKDSSGEFTNVDKVSEKKILFTVGKLRLLYSPPDWVIRKLKSGICCIEDKRVYACYKCGKAFETSVQLFMHMKNKNYFGIEEKQQTKKGEFVSPHNGKRFAKKEDLEQHLKTFRPFKCKQCTRRFLTEHRLNQHVQNFHVRNRIKVRRGKCPWYRPKFCCVKERCGAIFMDAAYLVQHHKDKPHYKCPYCATKCTKQSSLFLHIKVKHDIKDYNTLLRRYLQASLQKKQLRLHGNNRNGPNMNLEARNLKLIKLKNKIEALGGPVELPADEVITEGPKMKKSSTSHSVINIVPPREIWGPIQALRTRFVPDARCGPHFSFLDPFVLPKHYPEASKLLTKQLSTFSPFTVHLNNLNYFIHSRTVSLFLEPITEPPNGFHDLLEQCLQIFPQCNDLVLRSGKYHPHMTIAKFDSAEKMKEEMEKLKANWEPLKFEVKELYFLSRIAGDPFEVQHVIPLGVPTTPFFGPGSLGSFENPTSNFCRLSSTCVVCSIPQPGVTNSILKSAFSRFSILNAEILCNPDGSPRTCGVVEFDSPATARRALEEWTGEFPDNVERVTCSFSSLSYLIHLPNAVFPCYGVQDCCSLKAVLAGEWYRNNSL